MSLGQIKNTMSSNYKKREKIYDIYSQNFSLLKENGIIKINEEIPFEPICFCPTCFQGFAKELIAKHDEYHNFLTLEHVPPESYGGNSKILTCKKCNNEAGSTLDPEILEAYRLRNASKKGHEIKFDTKFIVNDKHEFNGLVTLNKDSTIKIEYDKSRSNPKSLDKALDILKPESEFNLDFKITGPHQKKHPLALLRIAHLLAFYKFGHLYLFASSTRSVAQLIKHQPESFPYKRIGISGNLIQSNEDGYYIITQPSELLSLLVIFSFEIEGHKQKRGIILPSPSDQDLKIYDKIDEFQSTNSDVNIETVRITNVNFLTDKKYLTIYTKFFDYLA